MSAGARCDREGKGQWEGPTVGMETGWSLGGTAGRMFQTQAQNWWIEGGFHSNFSPGSHWD